MTALLAFHDYELLQSEGEQDWPRFEIFLFSLVWGLSLPLAPESWDFTTKLFRTEDSPRFTRLPNLGALQSNVTWIRTGTKRELASFVSSTQVPTGIKISLSLNSLKVGSPRLSAIGDVWKICNVGSIWYMQASHIPEWADLSKVM